MRLTLGTLPLLFLATLVNAQTSTITTDGRTVVVAVTTTNGNPVTSTISTVSAAAGPNDPPPVAIEPDDTNAPAEPTWYWVTSLDADGNTHVNSYQFTPTFASSSPPVDYPEGTIYDYHSWTSQYATATFVPDSGSSRTSQVPLIGLSITLSTALAGALLILL